MGGTALMAATTMYQGQRTRVAAEQQSGKQDKLRKEAEEAAKIAKDEQDVKDATLAAEKKKQDDIALSAKERSDKIKQAKMSAAGAGANSTGSRIAAEKQVMSRKPKGSYSKSNRAGTLG